MPFMTIGLLIITEVASFRLLEKNKDIDQSRYADAEDKDHWYQVTALGIERLEKTKSRGK